MKTPWILSAGLLLLVACGSKDDSKEAPPDTSAGGATHEPGDFCPDPNHPRVHYQDTDASNCVDVELHCTEDQNGFQGSCGCGCIDKGDPLCPDVMDPSITWHSGDPSECPSEPPECSLGEIGFSNTCGCGCLLR